jgi:hypothetical protein
LKNRLPDPSKICALEFKGEFLRIRKLLGFRDCWHQSAIFKICESDVIGLAERRPSPITDGALVIHIKTAP